MIDVTNDDRASPVGQTLARRSPIGLKTQDDNLELKNAQPDKASTMEAFSVSQLGSPMISGTWFQTLCMNCSAS
jgi:hypothetical protein